jgi:glycosyltransferase involved in cell wall biosynthesis
MRIAVIVARYGEDVVGGAESQARGFAEEAARRGWHMEAWTSCARSHYSWDNEYPAGCEESQGVLVRRFPVTHWDPDRRAGLDTRLSTHGCLPLADQYAWVGTGAHSEPLYAYAGRHGRSFDALVLLPYAMPLTHYAACAASGRTIIWPCLHDEAYAYMEPVRLLLESTWGVMFNSPEEGQLATGVIGMRPRRHGVLGEGVTLAQPAARAEEKAHSNLLYVGRLEDGKNLPLLYEYVRRYWDGEGRVRLTVLGRGPCLPPVGHPAFDYRGFVDEQEKASLYASALALCQPSVNESFSLTIMESWLASRPVLVHADCAVTRGHARRSQGGLWFRSYDEFAAAVDWLKSNPGKAARMGQDGGQYVRRNYQWSSVVSRFERMIAGWEQRSN